MGGQGITRKSTTPRKLCSVIPQTRRLKARGRRSRGSIEIRGKVGQQKILKDLPRSQRSSPTLNQGKINSQSIIMHITNHMIGVESHMIDHMIETGSHMKLRELPGMACLRTLPPTLPIPTSITTVTRHPCTPQGLTQCPLNTATPTPRMPGNTFVAVTLKTSIGGTRRDQREKKR